MSDRCSRALEENDVELQSDDQRRHEHEEEQKDREAPDRVLLPGRFPGRRIASAKGVTRPVFPQPLREEPRFVIGHPGPDEETLETSSAGDDSLVRCGPVPAYGNPSIPAVLDGQLAGRGVH
jgi:hypothetical protein